jgi:hypothetical protein
MHPTWIAVSLVAAFALCGCGGDRTTTGAGSGAGGGAALAAITGGSILGAGVIDTPPAAIKSPRDIDPGGAPYR